MTSCYPVGPRSRRPFIVTSYVASPDGDLAAEMPAVCPKGAGNGEPRCSLSVHHWRERKTGPRHPLAVVVCRTHGECFTLYPPGYGPYRRQPVVRLSPDGKALRGEDDSSAAEFSGTLFEAAFDACGGRAWARETGIRPPERWWSTQGRHLRLAAQMLGVAADLAEHVRESIAAVLSVGAVALRERAKSRLRGYRAIGKAVCEVLERLSAGPRRPRQLLVCGHLIGRWGEPMHWDARSGVLRRSPFCSSERSAVP